MKNTCIFLLISVALGFASCKKEPPKPIHLQSISLGNDTVNITAGTQIAITVTFTPGNAVDTALVFTSSDTTVVTVKKPGLIKGIKLGTAYITVKNSSGTVSKRCVVNVLPVAVTAIDINKPTLNILIGNADSLTAIVLPFNATNTTVTWSSSDNTIASVDTKGTVSAKKIGTVTITATSADGKVSSKSTVQVADMAFFVNGGGKWDLVLGSNEASENVGFGFQNHSAYPIQILQWNIYNTKNTLIAYVSSAPGSPIATIPGGQAFDSTTILFVIKQNEPGASDQLQNWPLEVLFDCKGKHYKITYTFNKEVVVDL